MRTPLALLLSIVVISASAVAEAPLPSLVAIYSLETANAPSTDWRLTRGGDCVVAELVGGPLSERWQRLRTGQTRYLRVFPDPRYVVEYRPADLALINMEGDWARLQSVVDPTALTGLRQADEPRSVLEREAIVYAGDLDGVATEIWWLEKEQLPALVRRQSPAGAATSLRLLSVEPAPQPASARCEHGLSGYVWLDFADVGDRHGDPVVEALMSNEVSWAGRTHGTALP